MTYIIENVHVLDNKTFTKAAFLIKQDKIASRLTSVKKLTYMRMDASSFIMTPTYVFFDQQLPENKPFQEVKQYFLNRFILKGCTTILTTASIEYESDFYQQMKRKLAHLNTSPIDFFVAVKIPVRLLTPSFIRICKKEKIPAIFVRIKNREELGTIPWGWIREALFPYNCPIIPVFEVEQKERLAVSEAWKKITVSEKLPSFSDEIKARQPIPRTDLAKIGIFPVKANLLHGAELSYNMYMMEPESVQVEELDMFHYHSHRLVITVHKGSIIRAADKTHFRSGFGEQVKVTKPSFYSF
ncbi:hypothetical protein [Bacillus marasmi]|uniref:hypothetical protein n=1 Tax=Bacillus marasmi TaxID=1926279 RepID=UPI0011CAB1CB|nr:hypothetical protein [Bacillus marasmi]